MKPTTLFTIGGLALACAGTPAVISTVRADQPQAADWRTAHPAATWFRDAKFGIYFHWGPYSVPAYDNEWYSRNMYVKGSAAYKYHVAKYGGPEKFGYKDFIPQFTAEKFDADDWADLFQRAGTDSPVLWPSMPTAGPTGTANSLAGIRSAWARSATSPA